MNRTNSPSHRSHSTSIIARSASANMLANAHLGVMQSLVRLGDAQAKAGACQRRVGKAINALTATHPDYKDMPQQARNDIALDCLHDILDLLTQIVEEE